MNPVLSVEDAVEYLGKISAPALLRLAKDQKVGHMKTGRVYTFPVVELDKYIEAHTIPAQDNPWGLTDASVAAIRGGRSKRASA